MRTIFCSQFIPAVSVYALCTVLSAAEPGKATLAVAAVRPTPSLKESMANAGKALSLSRVVEAFDSQLIDRINATRKFEIVGRSDLKEVLKEQELGASGNVDQKTAARVGEVSGAKYLMVVTVDDFEDSVERMEFKTTKQVGLKRKIRISVVAKIYDSSTGKLLESANIQILKKDDRSDSTELLKDAELTDELLLASAKEAAERSATRVADVVFPVRVLSKRDKQITINRGEGGGVKLEQVWNVYALGEDLIDPDTNEHLGREEVLVGKVRIVGVLPKTSTAEILEDTGIEKGAVLRLPQSQD